MHDHQIQALDAGGGASHVEAGADVVCAARTASDIEAVAASVEDRGRRALAVPTDVTVTADTKITKGGKDSMPTFAPDGASVYFVRTRLVPGRWSESDLDYHADNIATMLTNNAGFNCTTSRVIVTAAGWPLRGALLETARPSYDAGLLIPGDAEKDEAYAEASVAAVVDLLDGCRAKSVRYRQLQKAQRAHAKAYDYAVLAAEWEGQVETWFRERFEGNRIGVLRQLLHEDDHVAARQLSEEILRGVASVPDYETAHEAADFCDKVIAGKDHTAENYAEAALKDVKADDLILCDDGKVTLTVTNDDSTAHTFTSTSVPPGRRKPPSPSNCQSVHPEALQGRGRRFGTTSGVRHSCSSANVSKSATRSNETILPRRIREIRRLRAIACT